MIQGGKPNRSRAGQLFGHSVFSFLRQRTVFPCILMPIWRKVLKFVCELWLGYPQTFSFMVFFNYWSKIFFCFFAKIHGKNVIFSRRRVQVEIGATELFY